MNDPTTPEQRTVNHGSHWMRVIDGTNWIYHFGYVPPAADWGDQMTEEIRLDHLTGNLHSIVYSRLNREGWEETVHQSDLWPISRGLFNHVAANGWDVRGMNRNSPAYHELTMAYSEILQTKAIAKARARRDFKWFLREVEGTVKSVGATGYRGFNRLADRRILLRFTKRAYAQGAEVELKQRGFHTTNVHPSGLDVLDRTER